MVAARMAEAASIECTLLPLVSTGDRQTQWSLEKRGGKGLFTAELEEALLGGKADIAVHSAKDLPGDMPASLEIAGYLPRADPRDVLVQRIDCTSPRNIATSSPRRRLQLAALLPGATFCEIRGNVDTRLNKISVGAADATVLAAAGLARLGITAWPGLKFSFFELEKMVPAIGQAAIAVQCRRGEAGQFQPAFDLETGLAVGLERALQSALGAGCHTATAAHVAVGKLYFFDERTGFRSTKISDEELRQPAATAARLLKEFGLS
jgi:hydroxymethylbilane synthase